MSMAYKLKRYVGFVSLVVFLLILSTEARAKLYGFDFLQNNSGTTVVDQLSVDVTDPPGDENVLFTFYNNGPAPYNVSSPVPSSITDVYFDDGALLKIALILDTPPVVDYDAPATPSNPPGWNTLNPDFVTTTNFSADSDTTPKGVNPGESVGILFDLIGGKTFADVIAAIEVGFDPVTYYQDGNGPYDGWYEPSLRIAMKVQGIGPNDKSDSFIMTPEPASLLLGSIGIGMVIARCRKRKTLIES